MWVSSRQETDQKQPSKYASKQLVKHASNLPTLYFLSHDSPPILEVEKQQCTTLSDAVFSRQYERKDLVA